MRRLRVTVLIDAACSPEDDPTFLGPPTEPSTEYHVVTTLRELGHEVAILCVDQSVEEIIHGIHEQKPDVIFNLTEQFRNNRMLDKNVAGLLELMDIPFTGAGSTGLMLCRGKGLCKQLLRSRRIRVPEFVVVAPGKRIHVPAAMNFPVVVKPVYEDGSDGISNASLVKDLAELQDRVRHVHSNWQQPAIAEEYVDGRELYVSVIGNNKLLVLPPRELFFSKNGSNGPVLATYRVKWDEEYQKKWDIKFGDAELDPRVFDSITRVCKKVFRLMRMRDYGRIDMRLTPDNRIVILEANPNPNVGYGDEVAEAAERAGISYENLINRILKSAVRRHRGR
jgi:D-alanine-D-alanine ligase